MDEEELLPLKYDSVCMHLFYSLQHNRIRGALLSNDGVGRV